MYIILHTKRTKAICLIKYFFNSNTTKPLNNKICSYLLVYKPYKILELVEVWLHFTQVYTHICSPAQVHKWPYLLMLLHVFINDTS